MNTMKPRGGDRNTGRGAVSPLGGRTNPDQILSGGSGHPVIRQSPAEALRKVARQPQKPKGRYSR
jgi:hypothetical protein